MLPSRSRRNARLRFRRAVRSDRSTRRSNSGGRSRSPSARSCSSSRSGWETSTARRCAGSRRQLPDRFRPRPPPFRRSQPSSRAPKRSQADRLCQSRARSSPTPLLLPNTTRRKRKAQPARATRARMRRSLHARSPRRRPAHRRARSPTYRCRPRSHLQHHRRHRRHQTRWSAADKRRPPAGTSTTPQSRFTAVPRHGRVVLSCGALTAKEPLMIARLSCRFLLRNRVNLAFVLCLAAVACSDARHDDGNTNGVRCTRRMRIATYADQHSERFYRLVGEDDETWELAFANTPPRVAPGTEIIVRGERDGTRLRVDEFDVVRNDLGVQALALDALPEKRSLKVAMIVVDPNYSTTRARQRLFQTVDSPAGFYKDNSYGDWTIDGDVFGPYTINIPGCGDSQVNAIATNAKAAAQADGVDLGRYDNLMYYLPASAGCDWVCL